MSSIVEPVYVVQHPEIVGFETFTGDSVGHIRDMTKVSVIGAAGTVGAAAGYNIALRGIADELVFVDIPDMEETTIGQAADTNHGVAYDSNTRIRQGGYEATEGSDVVVITAGIPRKEGQTRIDLAGDNAPIMEDIGESLREYNDDFVSITTSNPVDLLTLDVDLLVPAALENAIDGDLARDVRADVIVEAANGPLTPEADDVLTDADVHVFPDILANAGGVTVSYFEWVQNRQRFYWTEERVNEELERHIVSAFDGLTECYESFDLPNFRTAAYVVAVQRVVDAFADNGNWP